MWSLGGVFIKCLHVRYGVDPAAIACLRSGFAGLILAWALPGALGAPPWRLVASGLAFAAVVSTFVLATSSTTAANAIFLQYAYPALVAPASVLLFRERVRGKMVVAVLVGLAGVGVILCFSWAPGEGEGVLLGLGSAVAFAALTLLQRSMRSGRPAGLASAYNLMAALILLPFCLGKLDLSLEALMVILTMSVVQLGVPYVFFIRGLRTTPATTAAVITLVEPVLNPVWVWLALGEKPHPSTLAGGLLILVALLIPLVGSRKEAAS
jgi:drug/metabolite transporter (DMT)-like permease